MESRIDRRQLLKTGAAATFVAGTQFFVGVPALADYAVGPTMRRNASTMAANDPILRGYRRAILAMRALPNNNPCSWFYQAAIHGTTDPSNLPSWNTCHTDSTFFWAWHRMYLYFFERIVRKHARMYDWAIPYWDWGNPAERALPAAFRVATDAQLFDGTRKASVNAGGLLSANLGTAVNNAMTLLDYFNAQGGVDGPHGSVHGAVGGNMCCVVTAAQDPIFYVHHSHVDRLWNLWLAQGGGRSSPVGNSTWRNTTYTFFDECCDPVSLKGCDVLRAALQLSYSYEGEPAQVNQYCPLRFTAAILEASVLSRLGRSIVLERGPVRIPIPPRPGDGLRRMVEISRSAQRNVALRIRGVEAATAPEISWEVHVGRAGFAPNPRTLVGIVSLFGGGLRDRPQHFHPAEFVFPINRAIRDLDPATLEVILVPTDGLERGADSRALRPRSPVTIGDIEIIVDEPMPQPPREEQERLRREEEAGRLQS